MAVYNILPTTNLKWDDIRDTLNAGGGAVTNYVSTAFSASAKINCWSKHKPVKYNKCFCQDFSQTKPNYDANWWLGNDRKCGMNITHFNSLTGGNLQQMIDLYKSGNAWTYSPPTGIESEPFRLGDFAGYYPSAKSFFQSYIGKNQIYTINRSDESTLTISWHNNEDPSGNSLRITDFGALGEGLQQARLIGVILDANPEENNIPNLITSFISNVAINDESTTAKQLTIDTDAFSNRYTVWVMLCLGSPTVSNYIPIPYDESHYWCARIDLVKYAKVNLELIGWGIVGGDLHYPEYYDTYPFYSSNGTADTIFNISVKNESNNAMVFGYNDSGSNKVNFILNIEGGRWRKELKLCTIDGGLIPSKVINTGQTDSLYFRCDEAFKEFVETITSNQLSTSIYISTNLEGDDGQKVELGPYRPIIKK